MQLNNDNAEPLYRQLENILRMEIANGVYPRGGRFPTEFELSERYHVSRITVRGALEGLSRDHTLIRRQGRGSFVADSPKERADTPFLCSFTEMCRAQGRVPGGRLLRGVFESASADDAAALEMEAGGRIIVIERIRFADNIPVVLEACRFIDRFEFLLDEELGACSLHALLLEKYHIRFAAPRRDIGIDLASYEQARYLNVADGHPLLSVCGTVSDIAGCRAYRLSQFFDAQRFQLTV